MEEPVGAQYAIHIAVHTLKERCRSLQQRVATLEEENLTLRVQCGRDKEQSNSLTEADVLKEQITELSEQKEQLVNKIKMVTTENQELWSKLSCLSRVNQNLGSQLNKINDSLVHYTTKNKEGHSPLIRSKTFTQDEPQTKVLQRNLEENGKICSELEEISLKIINSFAQGKTELESLYSEIADTHYTENIISDSCGFYYDDFDDDVFDDFDTVLVELRVTKDVCLQQKSALKLVLEKLNKLQEFNKKFICDNMVPKKKEMSDIGTNTQTKINDESQESHNQSNTLAPLNINTEEAVDVVEMICPVCCKNFYGSTNFQDFQLHVEKHFTEVDPFELL